MRESYSGQFSFNKAHQIEETKEEPQMLTPSFKGEGQYDNEFAPYAQDIREVRSLVNLWKEEFIRRKTTPGLPALEKAVMEDHTRVGGYSQSILSMEPVYQRLQQHLSQKYKGVNFSTVDNALYLQLETIDYSLLSALISQREQAFLEDDGGGGMERFQMLGFGTMRQLHQERQGKAVMKSMQQQLGEGTDDDVGAEAQGEIDVLDIMDSLKEQFESLEQKYKTYRQGKSKYKTGKLASDIVNNKSIFDYMSPKKEIPLEAEIEEEENLIDEISLGLINADDESYALEGLFSESEPQYSELQEALLSIQNSQVKERIRDRNGLEEVKEEDSYMSEIASLLSSSQKPIESQEIIGKSSLADQAATQKETRYILKGDKIMRIRSPRRQHTSDAKPQEAFFSKKSDLVEHLNDVRRAKNDKRIQLKDLRVTFNDRVRKEIEVDLLVLREGPSKLVQEVAQKELYFKMAPSAKSIRDKYLKRPQQEKYQKQLLNITNETGNNEGVDKQQAKRSMIEANKNPRLVTPATQYDMRYMDSQQNVGGFERKHEDVSNNKKQTLFEIHKEFDQIYGLTVMLIEVFVQNRPGCVTNFEHDMISAVYFTVHNECAELTYGSKYHRVNGAIFN
ncbi:hypothetical protein FGO68_gene262 [Halteria grandinella]|uniref:Uncharacterized protein n=1 Tax=Halteria grandinella TaxID=5974 RepID=A0A8J8SUP6_HALGN|nr:hypothetical protein FGO68_gene262 [Halteria grandinella]